MIPCAKTCSCHAALTSTTPCLISSFPLLFSNYVLNRNAPDGTKLYVLRAGPYTDKDEAEAAEKKIKAMGLTPRLVETGKQ